MVYPRVCGVDLPVIGLGVIALVYPRVCGVDSLTQQAHMPLMGLSPRVRGRFHPYEWNASGSRFIPACAG